MVDYSDSDESEPSPPLARHFSSNGDEYYDASDIVPGWVQRMYGPPPAVRPPSPIPATVWVPHATPPPPGAFAYHPASPAYIPAAYNVHAYASGAMPCPPGGAVMRARSPSTSTGHHAGGSGDSSDDNNDGYVVPGRPKPYAGSPTKTPLFEAGHAKSDKEDLEAGKGEQKPTKGDFANENMPSRTVAMRERRRKQLRTCDKDSLGVPLPNTRRPFSLFVSPFKIAEVCTGLGVYLASLQATVILALLLSIVCIYPLVNNVTSQRWAKEYSLITGPGEAVASCPKGWDLTSWLTSVTIGGHCSIGAYTSKYDCAAQCVWSPERLNQPQCRGVKPPGIEMAGANATAIEEYKTRLSGKCAQHLPCVKDRLDPYAPDGPCLCCSMQQDQAVVAQNPRVPAAQLWTFFLGQLIFMTWMLYLMHTQMKAVHIQGTRVVGPSDYSCWISGISKTRAEDAPLAHWCGQFGAVVSAFNIPSVGEALRVGRTVAGLQIRKAEADALSGSTSWNPLQWIYRMVAVGRPQALEEKLEMQQRKLAIYERQESEPTGQGLVTFEYSDSAGAAGAAFDRPPLRALIDKLSLGLTNTTPRLHGQMVHVVRAPEPSDILWEHTNCTGTPAMLRRIWSWTLTALIILAGAGIQYGLAVAAEGLREDRMMAQYAAGTGAEWAVTEAAKKTRKLRLVSILSGVVVVLINLTVMLTMRALSWYERWTTRTSMERWVMLKLSLSQLCNAFAAPMLAAYASGNRSGWFSRGGLVEAAFYVQCANALVPPLFHLLGLGDKIKYYLLSPFARTQPMLNQLLAPPLFPMAEQHAVSVTTLGLAMFYMPVFPMSPMIALVGLSISYCCNKWIALRRAAAPPNFSGMVTAPLNWLLRLLPLIQMILMKKLYFEDYPTMTPVFYTGLAFWMLFCLAPIRALLGAVRRRRRTNASAGLSYQRLLGGKRLGVGDVYAPIVPKPCSKKFKEIVASTFAQLAPAAFETILNGEEVAKFLFGTGVADLSSSKRAALGLDTDFSDLIKSASISGDKKDHPYAKYSVRGSIAAGVHGTLALLWQPQDADHPEDVFLPAVEFGRQSETSDIESSRNFGIPAASAPPPPSVPPPAPAFPRARQLTRAPPVGGLRRQYGVSTTDSSSGSTAPSRGGSAGSSGNVSVAAIPVAQPPPPQVMTTPVAVTRVRSAMPATTTPGSTSHIPAVRHRTQSATPARNRLAPAVTPVPSRLGSRRSSQMPGGDPLDNFRPLGSGLSEFL